MIQKSKFWKEELLGGRLIKITLLLGLILIFVFVSGCTASKTFLSKPKSKAELLQRMKAKYKKIKRLSYHSKHVVTHDDAIYDSRVWEDPPFSLETLKESSQERAFLESSNICYSRQIYTTHGRKSINDMAVWSSPLDSESEKHPISLLSFTLSAASQEYLTFEVVRGKGLSFLYSLKGKPEEEGGVKEILIDPATFLPVKIVSEGEDLEDEIENISDYQINPTIPKSRFKIGFPSKTRRLVSRFAQLNQLPALSMEDKTVDDFPFDLYFPSQIPQGYTLSQLQVGKVGTSGTVTAKVAGTKEDFVYEFASMSFYFKNRKTDKEITVGVELASDEKVLKAGLLDYAGEGVNLNNSISEVIASLGYQGERKEANLKSGKVFYWLSDGKVSNAIVKIDNTWLMTSPAYAGDFDEQSFLTLAGSLAK